MIGTAKKNCGFYFQNFNFSECFFLKFLIAKTNKLQELILRQLN